MGSVVEELLNISGVGTFVGFNWSMPTDLIISWLVLDFLKSKACKSKQAGQHEFPY